MERVALYVGCIYGIGFAITVLVAMGNQDSTYLFLAPVWPIAYITVVYKIIKQL